MELDQETTNHTRTIRTQDGLEITIHSKHDLNNMPVTQQEIDLLLTYLGPLVDELLEKKG